MQTITVRIAHTRAGASGRVGPYCITCSNTRRFWVQTTSGERLFDLFDLADGDVRIVACGRCRARRSIILTHVD